MNKRKIEDLLSRCPGLEPVLEEMLEVSGYVWEKGWAERNAGNLSIDATEHIPPGMFPESSDRLRKLDFTYPALAGRYFLVTGSGKRFRDMAKAPAANACILRISDDGAGYRIIWGGEDAPDFRPTSEFPAHLRLHEHMRQTNAQEKVVLHTHPVELIALTHLPEYRDEPALNQALWSTHPEVKYNLPKGVGFVPYVIPGSEKLAQATLECFRRGYSVVLWEIHGSVSRAKEPMVAFDLIDIANKAASIVLMCRSAGHTPTGLTKEQLDEIARTFKLEE
ncbi:MAG: rhamnulose-1-phosphate aldolase [Candidatus Abyssobacteria bacterium SURF_5]|uniref:Rhamnulose-1-phosphate aldolase n=1 Tax=Abyssobacteria bacterium (strain SURF_5) TaxID=2093360 RepID=A0A3A4PCU9_ABYX5|nr:MAG: rhamnulose-1-phosphate aldolase [Candidatus Abyssubacteria bacterium SURF_5]